MRVLLKPNAIALETGRESIYMALQIAKLQPRLIVPGGWAGPLPSSRRFRLPGEQNEPLMPHLSSLTDGFRCIKVLILAEV